MILHTGSASLNAPPSVQTDAFRLTPDREKRLRNKTWTPSGESCLRCSGLLVLSYMAALESDLTGKPMTLWRCLNCGDYVDHDILANRSKSPVPAGETEDPQPTIVCWQPVKTDVLEVRVLRSSQRKKAAIIAKIDRVLVL